MVSAMAGEQPRSCYRSPRMGPHVEYAVQVHVRKQGRYAPALLRALGEHLEGNIFRNGIDIAVQTATLREIRSTVMATQLGRRQHVVLQGLTGRAARLHSAEG